MYPNVTSITYNSVMNSHIAGDRMDTESAVEEISVTDAAEKIGVSKATLARAARLGRLEAKKIGTVWVTTEAKALAWKQAFYSPHMKRK